MGISIRAYARHRGVSHTAVEKAIAAGRISPLADGSIDAATADAEWERNTFYPRGGGGSSQFAQARTVHEHYRARLARLDYEERIGQLVRVDEVREVAFNTYRQLRDRMLAIPDRIAAQLAAETDATRVHEILAGEIRNALGEFTDRPKP